MGDTTLLLRRAVHDRSAYDEFYRRVYRELELLARRHLASEREDLTLDSGDLINEACIRLLQSRTPEWRDRAHFLNLASRIMRRVLIDHARRRGALKRGKGQASSPLREDDWITEEQAIDWLFVHDELEKLEGQRPQDARVFELAYFGGLDDATISSVLKEAAGWELTPAEVERSRRFVQTVIASRSRSAPRDP